MNNYKKVKTNLINKKFFLGLLPFVVIIIFYLIFSHLRHIDNSQEKITPTILQLISGLQSSLRVNDDGGIPILIDTFSSVKVLVTGLIMSFIISLFVGVLMGSSNFFDNLLNKFVLYFGKIPPLALLPIIFIFSGLGDSTKILLIIIGITPSMILDIYLKIKSIPKEYFIKAATLGLNSFNFMKKIVLPHIMPLAINSARVNLLNAWVFLIAAESIAASSGLGYRIFVVRRYLAMDIILPYILWIALLSFALDYLLSSLIKFKYPWFNK